VSKNRKKMTEEKHTMHEGASPQIFTNATSLRKEMTAAEIFLWNEIKDGKIMNMKFRRQHPFNRYILDFYCHKLKLCVELDGEIHDNMEQKIIDEQRALHLIDFGLTIIRFKNIEVFDNVELVKFKLKEMIELLLLNIKNVPNEKGI
jgi:very-short-patch-repair endonuclease